MATAKLACDTLLQSDSVAEDITLYRVFIATPGGLDNERLAFRETLNEYNEADAVQRKAFMLPVGWEDTLAGIGRPQSIINNDLVKCDYFVLVLYDRWGTPPSGAGGYTSGTEEEFRLAMEYARDPNHCMKEVVVFFKKVDENRLKDPGDQLSRVLRFKSDLETSRTLLFSTVDNPVQFGQMIRRHIARWLRDHESALLNKTLKRNKELYGGGFR